MKVSLKLEDNHPQTQTQNPIHFKAKIPITVFSLPFLSAFSATHHHHSSSAAAAASAKLSLSLRTHFLSGPSLKLSYNTPTATAATITAATAPLTLTLKSGVSFSGSPNNSPLIISANFSFSPHSHNPNPSFTLQLKPRLGSFSLRKSVSSIVVSNPKKIGNGGGEGSENGYGFVPLDRGINWKDLTVESATKDSILSGVLMCSDTELPVSKRVKVNLRWGVNIPSDFEKQLPYLRVNKIKIERVDVKEEDDRSKKDGSESGAGEFEMLKGMYAWMSSELSNLRDENREMRRALEDVKLRPVLRKQDGGYNGGGGKRVVPASVVENSDGFEQWRMKKNGGGDDANGMKEIKKHGGSVDVESELQRAIKAASSS